MISTANHCVIIKGCNAYYMKAALAISLLFIGVFGFSRQAYALQDVEVSGAGSSDRNGIYIDQGDGTWEMAPYYQINYKFESGNHYCGIKPYGSPNGTNSYGIGPVAGATCTIEELTTMTWFQDTGSNPPPTVTAYGGGGGEEPGTTTASTTVSILEAGDIIFMLGWIIFFNALMAMGLFVNAIRQKEYGT